MYHRNISSSYVDCVRRHIKHNGREKIMELDRVSTHSSTLFIRTRIEYPTRTTLARQTSRGESTWTNPYNLQESIELTRLLDE